MLSLLFLAALLQKPEPKPQAAKPKTVEANVRPATVRGKVTAADTGAPLKHAQITLQSTTRYNEMFVAETDKDGLYELTSLDPGQYMPRASKPGYVSGPRLMKSNETQIALTLAEDQEVNDVNFTLMRGGVISGTVSDSDGSPVAGVTVQAMRKFYNNQGRPQLSAVQSVRSNDRGGYRLYDLLPGRYYVMSSPPAQRVGPPQPPPPFGAAFYPSVATLAEAQPVQLTASGESNGINFTVSDGEFYSVTGTITDSNGRNPSTFYANAYSAGSGGQSFFAQAKADGTFRFANVPPGHYDMFAGAPGVTVGKSFEVINADVTSLTVNLGSGATIKGQLVAEGGALPPSVRIFLNRNPPSNSGATGGYAESAADGSFTMNSVQPGTYTVAASTLTMSTGQSAFFVGATTLGSLPPADGEIKVSEDGAPLELSVVLNFTGGTITCNALDPDGQPLKGSGVVLLSADAQKRANIRYFKLGFADSKGAFKFQSVIPGDYLILLWPGPNPTQLLDPDVFAQVAKYAEAVTVEKSGAASKEVKLSSELRDLVRVLAQ